MRVFWKKTVKIVSSSGAPPLEPSFAPGGWGPRPHTSALLFPSTIAIVWSSFLRLNSFYYSQKQAKWLSDVALNTGTGLGLKTGVKIIF